MPNYVTNGTSSGNWNRDSFSDTYSYRYPCGHAYTVLGIHMQRGGQIAPPLCPTCHTQRVTDQMEAENWSRDPNWPGYAVGEVKGARLDPRNMAPPGGIGWLDYQIGTVRQRAWN